MPNTTQTAIIGAGIAGLTCARALADAGQRVVVFDKGRGLGGRMASRRADGWRFDHGAIVLRPTSNAFATFLSDAQAQGAAAHWPDADGWVGLPGMSSLVKPLTEGFDIVTAERVTNLHKTPAGWTLEGPGRAANLTFDQVMLAIPQPQALDLLAPWPALTGQFTTAEMQPCWTLMVGFDTPLSTDIAYSNTCDSPIAVIARETAKPGRKLPGDGWVIQANADWTHTHLELEPSEIVPLLLSAFFETVGCAPVLPTITMAHRWRYGLTSTPLGQPHLLDASLGLGLCGDWCLGDTAQAAFDSGRSLARAILAE
ncbi:MAG: FAD-dependent oxidoreductase [Octadecabacter sp.]|nr:FAD-dependent oxidoreductase [Octadecabacter sp.]